MIPPASIVVDRWRGLRNETKIRVMGLLKTRKHRSKLLRTHTALRCVVAGHQVTWCRSLCQPIHGHGLCGRPAPHALKGRTQAAIAGYNARRSRNGD